MTRATAGTPRSAHGVLCSRVLMESPPPPPSHTPTQSVLLLLRQATTAAHHALRLGMAYGNEMSARANNMPPALATSSRTRLATRLRAWRPRYTR
jgi:hypothetical protein